MAVETCNVCKKLFGSFRTAQGQQRKLILHLIPLIFSFPILIEAWVRKFLQFVWPYQGKEVKGESSLRPFMHLAYLPFFSVGKVGFSNDNQEGNADKNDVITLPR